MQKIYRIQSRNYGEYDAKGYSLENLDNRLADRTPFVVSKDSKAKGNPNKSFNEGPYKNLRDCLISEGILKKIIGGSSYEFTRDYEFSNPSAAASVVTGQSRSGKFWAQ